MSASRNNPIEEFKDKDYRESYAEDFLHTSIAMQVRTVREQRGMTQQELADEIETKQTAISRIENVNNRSRNLRTLVKVAFALGCRLRVSLETFGSLVSDEGPRFSRETMQRPDFGHDPVFAPAGLGGTVIHLAPVQTGELLGDQSEVPIDKLAKRQLGQSLEQQRWAGKDPQLAIGYYI
jgi:HTH-type transcriptional regulator/antitoxin HipB